MLRNHDVTELVVLGSSATGLAVVRSAHRLGLEVTVLDNDRGPAGWSRYANFLKVDLSSPHAVLESLERLPETAALIADSDRCLRLLRGIRDRVAQRRLVLHSDPETVEICLDKRRFHDWCRRSDVPTPHLHDADGAIESVRFPVIIRPEQTCHERSRDVPKAVEVRDSTSLVRELTRFRAAGAEPIVTESLLGRRIRCYSVGLAVNAAGQVQSLVAERIRPIPKRCAAGTFVSLRPEPRVQRFAESIAKSLGLFGLAEVEVVLDETTGELFAIEVNARPWLQFALADRSGHELLGFLLGRSGTLRPKRTSGLSWIDMRADLFHVLSRKTGAIRAGEVGLLDYLATLLRWHEHPTLSFTDPMPLLRSLTRRF
jgi:predicted ATP-grasp superfamily ATP-dependent carboligase